MKFENAVKRSIKSFYEGRMPQNFFAMREEDTDEIKFTPEFFDEMEEELGLESKGQEDDKADD